MSTSTKKKVTAKDVVKGRAVATTTKKDVAVSNVDATLMMRQDAGKGVSTSAEDNILPLIYILQAQSKQALKQKPEYIKGAEAGNIWPRGTKVLIDGENDGIPVICCAVRKFWTEWKPDRGGLAGKHDYDEKADNRGRPDDTEEEKDPKTGFSKFVRANGNELVESREHAVLVEVDGNWSPYVIAMKGSDHATARQWNGERLRVRLASPNDDFVPPAYAFVYSLKTIAKSNDLGDWYGWTYEHGGDDGEKMETMSLRNGVELIQMARSLHDAFMSGAKRAEVEVEINDGVAGSGDDGDM